MSSRALLAGMTGPMSATTSMSYSGGHWIHGSGQNVIVREELELLQVGAASGRRVRRRWAWSTFGALQCLRHVSANDRGIFCRGVIARQMADVARTRVSAWQNRHISYV